MTIMPVKINIVSKNQAPSSEHEEVSVRFELPDGTFAWDNYRWQGGSDGQQARSRIQIAQMLRYLMDNGVTMAAEIGEYNGKPTVKILRTDTVIPEGDAVENFKQAFDATEVA